MRVLTQFNDQRKARLFSSYLRKEGIENTCEVVLDSEKQKVVSTLWIHDEDDLEKADSFLREYEKNPALGKYAQPEQPKSFSSIANPNLPKIKQPSLPIVTYLFLALCVFVYMLNLMQSKSSERLVLVTPIQEMLMFDEPVLLNHYETIFKKYSISPETPPNQYPEGLQKALEEAQEKPAFRGFYPRLLSLFSSKMKKYPSGEMFIKIRQGEFWRLFTPAILHRDLLHILFNMLWLIFLGKQIEQRIGGIRFLIFILITGVIANVCQYLMSGPNFLGFSGVVLAMAGFIWVRKKIAPWEGYPLNATTLLFLAFFILAMMGLQFVTALIQITGTTSFMFNIANTAHLAGAFSGALLGKTSFFRWRG
jgi:GlpG protein